MESLIRKLGAKEKECYHENQWELGEAEPKTGSELWKRKKDEEENQRAVIVTNKGVIYPILIKHKAYENDQLREKKYTVIEIRKRRNLPWEQNLKRKQNKISLLEFASIPIKKREGRKTLY